MTAFNKVNAEALRYRHTSNAAALAHSRADDLVERKRLKQETVRKTKERIARKHHAANIRNYAERATLIFGCRMEG